MSGDPDFSSRVNSLKTAARNSVDQVATDLGYVLHREGQTLRMQGGASRSDNALAIFEEGRAWWDFSLNEGGDVIDFLVKKEQWSFQEACGWLAERAGTTWSSASAEEVQEQERRRRASDALTAAFEFMSRQLPPDVIAELRQDRDLHEEDLGRYRFGWQTEALRGYLEALGFSDSELCQTGLFSMDGRPKFSGRVLIPFVQGTRIVSYIGRATSAAPTHEQQTRYKKPAGEDVPDDGYLFGINTVAHATTVLVVEGPFDAIACHRAGFAAVAACGSSLSEKQAKRLVSVVRDGVRIVLVPDADPPGADGRSAGLEGAKKTAKLAWELGARLVFVARLPLAPDGGKHDPDSYVRAEGEDKFRQLVAEAEHLPFFLLKLIDQRKSAIDQSRELEVVLELLAELDDAIMEEPFFKAAAEHLILKEKTVEKKYRAVQKKLKNARDGQEDGEMLRIAQQANRLTNGELLCLAPPKSAKEHAAFHRVQPEGHILPVPPEALHDLVNEAAGRPLEPAEFTLVTWFLATSVLEHRGGEVIQTGILCKNGFIEFGRNPTFTPGRPDRPSQFYVPRNFITEEGALLELEELEIVKGFRSWGLDLLVLLEVIAHAELTEPPGEFFLFYGPGGEGKSTFARFIGLLLGEWNVLYTTAEEFSGDRRLRGIASTRGRLLVVVDDASARVLDTMGNFLKEATTAPSLTGAALYENPTTFANASCFVILSNHPSRRQDKSRGGQDRVQVLVWGNRLRATAAGVHSIEKIWSNHAAELDVIFSYAVRLAMDYARTGRWRCSAAPEQNLHIVEVLASTEGRFLWEQFERADDEFLDWDLVEELFHDWWPDYNHRPTLNRERFVQAVAITWGGRAQRRQVDGDRQRGVLGIRPLPKQVAVESPRPSLEEVFPGVIKGQSGQKNPRNEVPSSEKKKHEKEEKLSTEKNHTEKRSLPAVGNPGHPLACEDLALLAGAALDDEDHRTRARREILLRARDEGGLHRHRAETMLPAHLRSQFDRLVSEMVAAGELVLDGVWLHVSDVGEVSP